MTVDTTEGATFDLWVEGQPEGALAVVSFRGEEAVSRPFRFRVLVTAIGLDGAVEKDLLGRAASLTLRTGEVRRAIHGVVRRVQTEGVSGAAEDQHHHRLWLVPRLWLLGRNSNTRIFQDLSVPAIVARVLAESGVEHRFELVRPLSPRPYCVQYRESDLAFIERLLREEGVYYFFDHPPDQRSGEVVVFADQPRLAPQIAGDPALAFRDSGGMSEDDEACVRRFRRGDRVRPRASLLRELDWTRPSFDSTVGAAAGEDGNIVPAALDPLSIALGALGAAASAELPRPDDAPTLRVYDHEGEIEGARVGPDAARRHLEQHRAKATLAEAESRCRRVLPGHVFDLRGAPLARHDGRYLVLGVEHEGHSPEALRATGGATPDVYRNRLWCVPNEVPYRPARPARELQQVLETATVVGPVEREIHTDASGRIKVQFHWDRQGRRNEHSSCWIRTMQAWAGAGWGFQFVPRVGMEVVVTFLGGDADRPLVLGCVYNAEHPVPFPLPQEKTKSGIRTQSSRGGDGHHEISFEDAKGFERLHIRAQKDLHEHVLHNRVAQVGADLSEQVGGSAFRIVDRNRIDIVARDSIEDVGQRRGARIGGDDTTRAAGSRADEIGGNDSLVVAGSRQETVGGRRISVVSGAIDIVNGRHDVAVHGRQTVTADGLRATFGGDHEEHTGGRIKLLAGGGILLQCGSSAVEITDEEVRISAKKVTVDAADEAVFRGGDASLSLDGDAKLRGSNAELRSSGATVALGGDAQIKASAIKLASGGGGSDSRSSSSSDPQSRVEPLKISIGAAHEDGGELVILDGDGREVRAIPTTSADQSSGGHHVFQLDHESLPDPVEILFRTPDDVTHVAGPCRPAALHAALAGEQPEQARAHAGSGRRASAARTDDDPAAREAVPREPLLVQLGRFAARRDGASTDIETDTGTEAGGDTGAIPGAGR